jgi:hypothetical protein
VPTLDRVAGLSALTYTLIQAPDNGWSSAATLATGSIAVALLGAFAAVQLRAAEPMVDLRLFASPRFAGASLGVMALFFALTAATFVLTQIYQFVLGFSPLQAGLRALPPALMVAVLSPIGARISAKAGPRAPIAAGLTLATAGLLLYATASAGSGFMHYVLSMSIIGSGIGLAMAPATQSIMSALPPAKAGVGSRSTTPPAISAACSGSPWSAASSPPLTSRPWSPVPSPDRWRGSPVSRSERRRSSPIA